MVSLASPEGEETEIMSKFKEGIVKSPENDHELKDALLTLNHNRRLWKELEKYGY